MRSDGGSEYKSKELEIFLWYENLMWDYYIIHTTIYNSFDEMR